MPVKPSFAKQRAVKPALRRAAGMHALDHGAVLRRHQAGRLGAGDAERVHGFLGIECQPARRAGGGRENPDRGAGMPALADMLLAHAQADARPDLVTGDGGGEEIAAGQLRVALGDRNQRRQRHRADMQHGLAVHVVELEALHLRAVEQRRMRRGQPRSPCPRSRSCASCRAPRACRARCGTIRDWRHRWRSRANRE